MRADLGVEAQLVGPELEHVAEHGDAAAGRGRVQVVEGGTHRHRVGVVAVVDDDDRPRQLDALAAQRAERDVEHPARRGAERARRGERRERVRAHVGGLERQLERAEIRHVAAGAERHDPQVGAAVRIEQRLVGGQHGRRAGAQPVEQLGLRGGDRRERAQQLEVHGPDVDDDADVRLGDLGELGDLAAAAHRQLEHERLGAARRAEDRQRQADLGVEVLLAGDDPPVLAQHRREQVLRRRLARRAGDRDDLRAELAPPCARQPLQGGERVVGGDDDADRRAARVAHVLRRDDDAPGPGVQRRAREPAAV